MPSFHSERLLSGFSNNEDAAVYQIDEDNCIVSTLDFFTPIVDDPYLFGAIAAANALSDIYAMGAKPILAMNMIGFPDDLDDSVMTQILLGGADKVKEADALLVGGHSIVDHEPKYGLSVIGQAKVKDILFNHKVQKGDYILMTKSLGTGILSTAMKRGLIQEDQKDALHQNMLRLNKYVMESVNREYLHAATDITGFGLIGHLLEMIEPSGLAIEIDTKNLSLLPGTKEYALQGVIAGGLRRNKEYYSCKVQSNLLGALDDIVYDPQTSGGLLLSIDKEYLDEAVETLSKLEDGISVLGQVQEKVDRAIILK